MCGGLIPIALAEEEYSMIKTWGKEGGEDGQFKEPIGITIDGSEVYVVDQGNIRIQKFTNAGNFITSLNMSDKLSSPNGIASNRSGTLFIVDLYENQIDIVVNGTIIKKWGSEGTGDGQFNTPTFVAADSSGNFYVTDTGNNRIEKFTSDGKFITKWGSEGSGDGQLSEPAGIALDFSGNVYVTELRQ